MCLEQGNNALKQPILLGLSKEVSVKRKLTVCLVISTHFLDVLFRGLG